MPVVDYIAQSIRMTDRETAASEVAEKITGDLAKAGYVVLSKERLEDLKREVRVARAQTEAAKRREGYTFKAAVRSIEEKFVRHNWRKNADGVTTCDSYSLGYFLALEGSHESLFVGSSPPTDLKAGDVVIVTIRKE